MVDVKEAFETLKKDFPGRGRVLINILLQREADKKIPDWRAEQLIQFVGLIEWFVEDLLTAHDLERVMTVAWLARNLLELNIWVRYCNLSEAHADRFAADRMRDFYGYIKALEGLTSATSSSAFQVTDLLKRYSAYAESKGIEEIGDDFTRVSKAAEELGEGKLFSSQNKIFSKLAHPTALAMDAALRKVGREQYRNLFVVDAAELAIRATEAIEEFVLSGYANGGFV
jgi:hypothetical protein